MAKIQSVRFVAYSCPEAPPHLRWLGEILLQPQPTSARPDPREQPFSMRFWARTKEHAIARAQAWWAQEQADLAAKREAAAKRVESNRKVAA